MTQPLGHGQLKGETVRITGRKAHQIIENFMLINDSTTIAVEVPIYYKNLTGHIDILQIRYNKLYILDYKPQLLAQLQ